MKDKIVFWGMNHKNQNVLVTLRLRAADNKVDIWMFEKSTLSQEFIDKMFEDWANIDVDTLPEPYEYLEHDMSSPSILPDTILANNTEMINRAEKEWYVKILATKLAMKLQEEITQLVEQVRNMTKYDKDIWALSKEYWDKINQHYQSKDLTKDQTASLRDMINQAFDKLKKLRRHSNEEFEQKAKENADAIIKRANIIIAQVADSRNLNGLFDTLKQMQIDIRKERLTQDLRNVVANKMNEAFQIVKDARRNHRNNRMNNRIRGLDGAIARMEKSVRRDEDDFAFQNRRIQASEGKLEKQLREAKIVMIQERLTSKGAKLKDMYKTMKELKDKIREDEDREIARQKAEKQRAEQRAKREATRKAKQAARKLKRAEEAAAKKAAEQAVVEQVAEKTEKAKDAVQSKVDEGVSQLAALKGALTEKTAEATETVESKLEETATTLEEVKEGVEEKTVEATETVESKLEETATALEEVKEGVEERAVEATETVESKAEETATALEEMKENVEAKVEERATVLEEVKENIAEKVEDAKAAISEKLSEAKEATESIMEQATAKVEEVVASLLPDDKPSEEEAEAESLDIDDILSTGSEENDSKKGE